MPVALILAHVKDDAAWEIPKPPPAPKMMAADADPVFAVATIKPSDPSRRRLFSIGTTEVSTVGTTVSDLIVFAFGVHAGQISGRLDSFPEICSRHTRYAFERRLQVKLANLQDSLRVGFRFTPPPQHLFVAGPLTLVHQTGSQPPDQRMKPEHGLDNHMHQRRQIVAAAKVTQLMGQNCL